MSVPPSPVRLVPDPPASDQQILAGTAEEGVVPCSLPVETIVAALAPQEVLAPAAVSHVGPAAPAERVGASPAPELVRPVGAHHRVVPCAADHVLAGDLDRVGLALAPAEGGVPVVAGVLVDLGDNRPGALLVGHGVDPDVANEGVALGPAVQRVVAGAAVQDVLPGVAADEIVPPQAVDPVGALLSHDHVVALGAGDDVRAGGPLDRGGRAQALGGRARGRRA